MRGIDFDMSQQFRVITVVGHSQVLRLLETFELAEVHAAVKKALNRKRRFQPIDLCCS